MKNDVNYSWGLSSYVDKATKDAVTKLDVSKFYPNTIYSKDFTKASSYSEGPMLKLKQFCKDNNIDVELNVQYEGEYLYFEHKPTGQKYKFKKDGIFDPNEIVVDWLILQLDAAFCISDPFIDLKKFCIDNGIEFDIVKISYSTVYELYFYKNNKRKVYTVNISYINRKNEINHIIDDLIKEMLIMPPKNIAYDFDGVTVDVIPLRNNYLEIKKVIFNNPATIVYWSDGTKTVVKCQDGDTFDKEKGLAIAICKRFLGTNKSKSNFNDIFKKWCDSEE